MSQAVIVQTAVHMLDERGERALTVRALAARLATGAGAIYHHIGAKDALLAAAADAVVTDAVAGPAWDIRALLLRIFDLMDEHAWLGAQLSRAPWQPAVMRLFEAVGERLEDRDVPGQNRFEAHTRDWLSPPATAVDSTAQNGAAPSRFEAASALVQYILGAASQHAASAHTPGGVGRAALLREVVDEWDAASVPFLSSIADQLAHHDDRRQFQAGVDLLLAGLSADRGDG